MHKKIERELQRVPVVKQVTEMKIVCDELEAELLGGEDV